MTMPMPMPKWRIPRKRRTPLMWNLPQLVAQLLKTMTTTMYLLRAGLGREGSKARTPSLPKKLLWNKMARQAPAGGN
jgi:hypothetical protein